MDPEKDKQRTRSYQFVFTIALTLVLVAGINYEDQKTFYRTFSEKNISGFEQILEEADNLPQRMYQLF